MELDNELHLLSNRCFRFLLIGGLAQWNYENEHRQINNANIYLYLIMSSGI